jgi:Spy/CpxP family protein refolding chaperone
LLVIMAAMAATAAAESLEDRLAAHLFPPDLIMRHQRHIGLGPEQREAVTRAVRAAQREFLDLQWQLEDATAALIEVLARPDPDDAQVLEHVQAVLAAENTIKQRHILLLLEIRRLLSPEQRAALREAAADHR